MSKIRILPEVLSNKIAAGEVVERPASVVKELVENALDAGSSRIIIEIEKGGRSLIRVSDNGIGMNRDDALLAIERYATSKIFTDQDLFSIRTLGFRGEALPSIASVSRLSVVTKDEASAAGTEIVVEGGTVKKVSDIGAPQGTMVSVGQLFFNTPARRKFLKTVITETGHIVDTAARSALGRPDVQFKLVHNGKTLKSWPMTTDPLDRVVDVLGKDTRNDLNRITFEDDAVAVEGWASLPKITRSTSRGIYVYVNGRFVRDRIVQHALFEGYSGRLVKGQFPVAVLFIRVPFERVDVNVHPTKHEVRFAQQKEVHDGVVAAVSEGLRSAGRSAWVVKKPRSNQLANEPVGISESAASYKQTQTPASDRPPTSNLQPPATSNQQPAPGIQHPVPSDRQTSIWAVKGFGDLRVIGQLHGTYILCESTDGLVLIDQHAAHERIYFEQLKNRHAASKPAAQKLLVPETIDLGYRETQILKSMLPDLNEMGLEIEPFGGNTFVVKTVPALLSNRAVTPLIVEIVEKMAEIGYAPGLEKALDECLMLIACHGAVRAKQKLSDTEIKDLLNQLDRCDNPSHCPHGRPTWIRWSVNTIERSFKRIV